MFKITAFTEFHPNEIGPSLRAFRFKETQKGEFKWSVDGHDFLISPFGTTGEFQKNYGYRIYFNGSIDGGLYLFDLSMGCFQPMINAVEFDLLFEGRTQTDWISDLSRRPSFKKTDLRGIYQKGRVTVICLPNGTVTLQLRSKHTKTTKFLELLKEVEAIREELTPVTYDLFTTLQEGEAV